MRCNPSCRHLSRGLLLCSWVLLFPGCSTPVEPNGSVDAGQDSSVPAGWDPLCWEHSMGGNLSAPSFCYEGDLHRCVTRDTREVTDCVGSERCALTAEEFVYADHLCISPAECENHTAHCLPDGVSFVYCLEYHWDGAVDLGEITDACADGEICVPDATQIRCASGPVSG